MTDEIVKRIDKKADYAARVLKSKATRAAKLAAQRPEVKRPEPQSIDITPEPEVVSPTRTQTRVSARTGRLEVEGRGGEILSRTRTDVADIFEVPKSMWPNGWSYQWCAISVAGNSDILLDQAHMMHQNGSRPVPAERHAGVLVPKGSTGNIIRGQQMLMERPESLTEEARGEELQKARQLISDRNESLKLTKVKDGLADGMEMSGKYRGTGGGIRMQIDKSLDVLNVNRESGRYQTEE